MTVETTDEVDANTEPDHSPARSPSVGKKLIFAVVLLLVLAGLAEVGARVAYRISRGSWNFAGTLDASEKLYVPHPYNAYSLAPNTEIKTHVGVIHTNEWGNRGPTQEYKKPPGVVRIVTLGGSTTFCPYATEDAKTWPARLEARLNERFSEVRFEVVNYGAAGYNSADSLTTFALRAIDRNPDILIIHHATNDIGTAIRPGLVSDYTHRRKAGSHRRKPWYFNLALYRTCRVYMGKLAKSRLPLGTLDDIDPRGTEIFERNLESIVLLAKPRGIETVLLTFASRLPADNDPDWREKVAKFKHSDIPSMSFALTPLGAYRAFKAYNDATRRIAERNEATLVDLANTYPRADEYFVDLIHKRDEGLDIFAELVVESLVEQGVIDRVIESCVPQSGRSVGSATGTDQPG